MRKIVALGNFSNQMFSFRESEAAKHTRRDICKLGWELQRALLQEDDNFIRHTLLEHLCQDVCQAVGLTFHEVLGSVAAHALEEAYQSDGFQKISSGEWTYRGVGLSSLKVALESVIHELVDSVVAMIEKQSLLNPNSDFFRDYIVFCAIEKATKIVFDRVGLR